MPQIIKVGIADMNICYPPDTITTIGLGSCVGIAIRDVTTKVGGLVHIMLPDSTMVKSNQNIAKFADTGIKELVLKLESLGCSRQHMVAKIAGGAQMFAFQNKTELTGIGAQNTEASKVALRGLGIPIIAEDVGANYGRTVIFNPENGAYEVRAVGKDIRTI
ncbi:MAG TPA: chemotaxis protein CheD [Lachnospiraceae bacterium]|nr:chemotaxis protein CheD [Lachnospiraceae bacterium]HPF28734.1 chemotaxis protein CheD [Lachnospiraceae bacterium]